RTREDRRAKRRTACLLRRAGARADRTERRGAAPGESGMTGDRGEPGLEDATPVWAVFGDLMAGLLGAFVLVLVGVIGMQLELTSRLEAETERRQRAEEQR